MTTVSTQSSDAIADFVRESNKIEGITRKPYGDEIEWTRDFLKARELTVPLVAGLVCIYAPNRPLRTRAGMDVRVGLHHPPPGGPHIRGELQQLLEDINANRLTPYEGHQRYETLHPFMDGNGRSGRAIWLWQMGGIERAPLGFLHHWYYQSLQAQRK